MNILMVGDIVGQAGCDCLKQKLPALKLEHNITLTVVNGENSAKPNGISKASADAIFAAGADVITTGNHVWFKREINDYLEEKEHIVRPANYPAGTPGRGYILFDLGRVQVAVVNLLGCVYMESLESPFEAADRILKELSPVTNYILLDFHAEATSEKIALARYLDGRISALVGTHTHVQTADETIFPGGTAYITDLGMTGAVNSILGVKTDIILKKFLSKLPVTFEQETEGDLMLCGAVISLNADGKAEKMVRIRI